MPPEDWRLRHFGITALLWVHVPAIVLFALYMGLGIEHALAEAAAVAAFAILASSSKLGRRLRSVCSSLGLLMSSAVLVHLSGGLVEFHFLYFVMVVVVALYQDWVPFLLFLTFVLGQHGVMGALDPAGVYNHPDAVENPWKWAAIHTFFLGGASIAVILNWRLHEIAREREERTARRAAARAEELVLLQTASNAIARTTDAETIIDKVVEAAAGLQFAETSSFYRWYPEDGALRCIASRGHDLDHRPVLRPGEGFAGRVSPTCIGELRLTSRPCSATDQRWARSAFQSFRGACPLACSWSPARRAGPC